MVSKKIRTKTSRKTGPNKNKSTEARPKKKIRTVYDFLNLPEEKLTPKEKKQLEEWRQKAAELEKIFTARCKICDKAIPEGDEYCGSLHRRMGEDGLSKEESEAVAAREMKKS